jgi:hypothetical protein
MAKEVAFQIQSLDAETKTPWSCKVVVLGAGEETLELPASVDAGFGSRLLLFLKRSRIWSLTYQ